MRLQLLATKRTPYRALRRKEVLIGGIPECIRDASRQQPIECRRILCRQIEWRDISLLGVKKSEHVVKGAVLQHDDDNMLEVRERAGHGALREVWKSAYM